MSEPNIPQSGILHFGPISLELRPGDVLMCAADVFCCPVDSLCQTEGGLFGILTQRKAFSAPPLGTRRRLPFGNAILVPTQGLNIPNAILVSLVNDQAGTVSRESIQAGLTQALTIADKQGFSTMALPFLGHAQSKFDYDIGCGMIIKTVRAFGLTMPRFLRHICLYAFNAECHMACLKQFFSFEQSN